MNADNRLKKMENRTKMDDNEPGVLKELDKSKPELAAYIRKVAQERGLDKKPGGYDNIANIWARFLIPVDSGDDNVPGT